MTQLTAHKTILQRKLSQGAVSPKPPLQRSGQWAHTLVSSASAVLGLPLLMGRRHALRTKAQDLNALMADMVMITWADAPEGQGIFVGFDAAFLSAVIEIQTIGRVLGRACDQRATTATDFALCVPFIEQALQQAADQDVIASVNRPKQKISGVHDLMQRLGVGDVDLCIMSFRLGQSDLTGKVCLGVPSRRMHPDAGNSAPTLATLCPQLEEVSADLPVVIYRHPTTLGQLQALKVGDLLTLPKDTLTQATLGAKGGPVFRVELGRSGAKRAVRLATGSELIPTDFFDLPASVPPETELETDLTLGPDLEKMLDQDWMDAMADHEKAALPLGEGGA